MTQTRIRWPPSMHAVALVGGLFLCAGCTWRIQLVTPPVQIVPVEDTDCRIMANAIYRCLPDAERACVDARQSMPRKERGE